MRIALAYFLFASSWIVLTDLVLGKRGESFPTLGVVLWASIAKGLFFTSVTSVLLYLLIRKQLSRLETSEHKFRESMNRMADAVLIIDSTMTVVETNQAALRLFGVNDKSEILGPIERFASRYQYADGSGRPIPFDQRPSVRALRGETVHNMEINPGLPDKPELVVGVSAAPVTLLGTSRHRGRPLAIVTMRDITNIKRLERLRDEFLENAAHELKTPLAVLKANDEMLLRFKDSWDSSKVRTMLETMDRQCDRMNLLIEQLLEISRLNLSRFQLKEAEFDLSRLVTTVVETSQNIAKNHRLRLNADPDIVVRADPIRIDLVISHLIENAIKFSPAGGEILVSLKTLPNSIRLTVEDRGIGIPASVKPHIFERFFHAPGGEGRYFGGMGIGLNLSREIIQRHGGTMDFESAENRGSKFFFDLPLNRRIFRAKAG